MLTDAYISRKAELFSDFMQPSGQQPLKLVDIGAGTLPNSRYYKVSMLCAPCTLYRACLFSESAHYWADGVVSLGTAQALPIRLQLKPDMHGACGLCCRVSVTTGQKVTTHALMAGLDAGMQGHSCGSKSHHAALCREECSDP